MAVKPRRYHSPARTAAALETRSRIVAAARDLFVENGYPATTIAAIASRAEVAPDTVYATFGGKLAVLKATMDVVVGGDERDVKVLDRTGPQAMRAETDQRRQIAMFAAGLTQQLERIAPVDAILRGAAAVDPAAASSSVSPFRSGPLAAIQETDACIAARRWRCCRSVRSSAAPGSTAAAPRRTASTGAIRSSCWVSPAANIAICRC